MSYNLDDIDAHIANLRSTLRFFTEALEHTDHTCPDWLATDLLSLRNSSGRLQDGMQRFREQILAEGLAEKKVWVKSRFQPKSPAQPPPKPQVNTQPQPQMYPQPKPEPNPQPMPQVNLQPKSQPKSQLPDLMAQTARINIQNQTPVKSRNRLSLHGSERGQTPEGTPRPSPPPPRVQSRTQTPNGAPREQTEERNTSPQAEYPIQHIDVTEEVQRRLREARLRRLMDSPSTSHKRKFEDMEGVESGGHAAGAGMANEVPMNDRKRCRMARVTMESSVGRVKRKEEVGQPIGREAKRVKR